MKVAICDDEIRWINEIKEKLENLYEEEKVEVDIDCFTNQEDLLEKVEKGFYNLVYLDIEMEGKNGIEVAKGIKLKNPACIVIFVTAYENYVTDAFKVSAFQYISKPIDDEIFKEEFGRAVRRFRKTNLVKVFKVKEGKRSFHLNDIISIESYYNTTFIRTTKGVHITNYENLRRIRREVLDYDFVRVQAGFIVNMNYIASIRYRGVELMTGQVLAVSIKNFRVVMEKYEKFIHSKEY